jgi:5-methylthioadenosine/S-adenosylhomocysteine deaminase
MSDTDATPDSHADADGAGAGADALAVTGGRVLRGDLSVERADVLVDRGTGRISDVAPGLADAAGETLDASGGLVVPGLVNAHGHAAMTLLRGYADDKPLEAWLREDVWPVEAELDPADVRAGTDLALAELIRSGTTTLVDMYFHVDAVVDAVAAAGVRARVGHGVVGVGKDEAAARADLDESLRVAREYDGAADGRVRTAVTPHSLTTLSPALLREAADAARDLDVPLHFHANETRAEVEPFLDEGRRPLEAAREWGLLSEADFLAHGVHLDDAEVEVLAETGTGVVHCPASNMKLASGTAPVQRLRDAGVPVALGTDGAASNNDLDGFGEMRDAAMVGKLAAGDAAAVPAEAVVEMATAGGAAVVGVDAGRVEPGALADLAVVDLEAPHLTPLHDPVSHLAYAARGSDVRHTVCDGRVLMRDRTLLTVDEAAVRERAGERARSLLARAEG